LTDEEIVVTKAGPLLVKGLKKLIGPDDSEMDVKPEMAFCRCGASKEKPFCDGSHVKVEFTGKPSEDRLPNTPREYRGKQITVIDNRVFCSHDGTCITNLPQVFSTIVRPWIQPDRAIVEKVIDICQRCPSGALSYKLDGKVYDSVDQEPSVTMEAYGPLNVVGGIKLTDTDAYPPQCKEHYSLCRCGLSSNPPYCEGRHFQLFDEREDPWA